MLEQRELYTHNLRLVIAYDGTPFLGWQKTKMGPSVQETVETVLERILQHPIVLEGASRTDAGVHAEGQVAHFFSSKKEIIPEKLMGSLNALLPDSIAILRLESVPLSFHSTLDALAKEYRYFLCTGKVQLPRHRLYSWHVPFLSSLDKIPLAFPMLIGKRNFASFCNSRKEPHYSDYEREIHHLDWVDLGEGRLCLRIRGNRFLYKMARNLVGTLVDIGRGKIDVATLPEILEGKNRVLAGVTAPPHPLFLYKVFYAQDIHSYSTPSRLLP